MDQQTSLLIMNELYAHKHYADCINVYEIYVTHMKVYEQSGEYDMKSFVNGTRSQLIHKGQFRLVTLSFLRLGGREDFEQMKKLLFSSHFLFNSKMSSKSLTSCFLLSIQQVRL